MLVSSHRFLYSVVEDTAADTISQIPLLWVRGSHCLYYLTDTFAQECRILLLVSSHRFLSSCVEYFRCDWNQMRRVL
jgi:hypothetical protein